jgi:monofunctional biosynthetic peptidoglycan transglycosylase
MTNHIDFTNPNEAQNWVIVNDTVMGGRSKAAITLKDGSLVFSGDLSLQNNGGFASTRRIDQAISWDTGKPFEIKVLGDGRNYQFRLRTNRNVDGVAYVANFKTQKDEILTVQFELDDFVPQFRGRFVQKAAKLDFSNIEQLGFMLADKNEGAFSLKVVQISQIN